MRLTDLDLSDLRFRTSEEVVDALRAACEANPDLAQFQVIGRSEEGRPIAGVTLGYGPRRVTLCAGAHADEPVGPETLRRLVLEGLAARDWGAADDGLHALFERFTFRIVPHVNPDAEARNQPWVQVWNDGAPVEETLRAFLAERLREPPGRDVEFGYPVMRPENRAVSRFLFDYTPIALHASLHGMAFAEGALLLIERRWAARVDGLKRGFAGAAAEAGLGLHDHDRKGDKGFRYYGPGFWSTPEGRAMQQHFLDAGDPAMAARFFLSSMETAVLTGRDSEGATPLCLVTEIPLFHLAAAYDHAPGVPARYDRLREELPERTLAARHGEPLGEVVEAYGIEAVPLETAVRLHLRVLELGLETAG
ncbi:MAG: M14 family zinc carboxypeptidase [Rubricoccaceae bacterium]|nr:M14 family zinc carboxypeptidase [Rubricoccaceae bacterium]